MNRGTSLALLVVGIVLVVWGLSASDSLASGFSEFFTGSPTDKAIWLIIGGLVAGITGLVGVTRAAKAA